MDETSEFAQEILNSLGEQLPWPEAIWSMRPSDLASVIPDDHQRTAVSGMLMREGWYCAMTTICRIYGLPNFAQKRPESDPTSSPLSSPSPEIQTPPEAQECKSVTSCLHQGFPPTNEFEIENFYRWWSSREPQSFHSDELDWLKKRTIGTVDKLPPKWLLERFRRETEQ